MGRSIFILFAAFLTPELVASPVLGFEQSEGDASSIRATEPSSAAPLSSPEAAAPSVVISSVAGSESKTAAGSQDLVTAIFTNPLSYLLLFLFAFYVLLIIPQQRAQRRQKKEQTDRLSGLKKNDRIVTASGIHAVVTNINSEAGTITVRIDENSNAKLTIDRDVVRTVLKGA